MARGIQRGMNIRHSKSGRAKQQLKRARKISRPYKNFYKTKTEN